MSNKELLELAAKAAGMKGEYYEYEDNFGPMWGFIPKGAKSGRDYWNPLTDDADAFGLAVKLAMSVEISAHEESTYAYAGDVPRVHAFENWRNDRCYSTRRAIVRCAAELAKAQPDQPSQEAK